MLAELGSALVITLVLWGIMGALFWFAAGKRESLGKVYDRWIPWAAASFGSDCVVYGIYGTSHGHIWSTLGCFLVLWAVFGYLKHVLE